MRKSFDVVKVHCVAYIRRTQTNFYMHSKTLILDIEGTTTPISFVSEILFPFASKQIGSFLENNWDDPEVITDVNALFIYAAEEVERTAQNAIRIARDLIFDDVKLTALKSLQGKIWRTGYQSGDLRGALFEDVAECIINWSKKHHIFIYSSGSVEAQKLLFGYSEAGDLCPYFEGHFDTKIGSKKDRSSYEKIAESLKLSGPDLYFLTDSEVEAGCAMDADWNVILMTRPGNAALIDPKVESLARCNSFPEVSALWSLNES